MANKTKSNTEKNKRVSTMLMSDPHIHGTEAEQQFFAVNGKTYIVQTDTPVELPAPLAEVVKNKNTALTEAKKRARAKAFKDSKPPVE